MNDSLTKRFPKRLQKTDFAVQIDSRLKALGPENVIDLTESNPSRLFPEYRRGIAELFAEKSKDIWRSDYEPSPKGSEKAREAIATYYANRNTAIQAHDIRLASSTSEIYSLLFKVFGNPGQSVLVPKPSYPLFEHLARGELLEPTFYKLSFEGQWEIDRGNLNQLVQYSTNDFAAILAVSPNNPTGHYLAPKQFDWLARKADKLNVPLIVDEVFLDYNQSDSTESVLSRFDAGNTQTLCVLSGLSKVAGLPGAKLSWLASPNLPERKQDELDFVADQFLSVSKPVQHLAPSLIRESKAFRAKLNRRLTANLSYANSRLNQYDLLSSYPVEGGWYKIIRFPNTQGEKSTLLELLKNKQVLVQPGFLYDIDPEGHFVISLLPRPDIFERGFNKLMQFLANLP